MNFDECVQAGIESGMEKVGGQGLAAATGAVAPVLAGLGAEEGKGLRTTGGSLVGSILGGSAANELVKLTGSNALLKRRFPIAALATMLGGGLGAYLAHGPNTLEKAGMEKVGGDINRLIKRLVPEAEHAAYRASAIGNLTGKRATRRGVMDAERAMIGLSKKKKSAIRAMLPEAETNEQILRGLEQRLTHIATR